MFEVTINKAELQGNFKDGFNNNCNRQIAKFEANNDELHMTEFSPKPIRNIAREYFAGSSFPLTESGNNYIGKKSKALSVEWESEHDNTVIYGVFYRGQYVGEIVIVDKGDQTDE